MRRHCRRGTALFLLSAGAAAVFAALSVQAAVLGHSRVTSLPDQPLRIVVQLKDLSAAELQRVSVQIAPLSAWQEAGLTPPVALDSLSAHLIPAVQPNAMQIVLQSPHAVAQPVLDVLIDVKTPVSTQRHQVSVLASQAPTPMTVAVATPVSPTVSATEPRAATAISAPSMLTVRQGQTLYRIARQWRQEGYSDQQMMAALVQANPDAFSHGNMNLLRAGARLQKPDAATLAAITPEQAKRLYQRHLQWFDEYRQRLATGQSLVPMPETETTSTKTSVALDTATDRLQLSRADDDSMQADQAAAVAQEITHTAQRLAQLENTSSERADVATENNVSFEAPLLSLDSVTTSASESKNTTLAPAVDARDSIDSVAPTLAAVRHDETAHIASEPNHSDEAVASRSWFGWWAGFLVLAVIIVAWLLRRAQHSRVEYAEAMPYRSTQVKDRPLGSSPVSLDEVEFREIKE